MSEELKKEWEEAKTLDLECLHGNLIGWCDVCPKQYQDYVKSFFAKQQTPTAMTNSEWIAYGKKMGYHDYWKDMTRISVEEEFVKSIPEEKEHDCTCDETVCHCEAGAYNKCIADIKSKLK